MGKDRFAYKNITGSVGIRVNTFKGDTDLDHALRLLKAATERVEDAVNDMRAADLSQGEAMNTSPSHPPRTGE